MHKKDLGLKLVLCPTREPDKSQLDIYNKIYDCWHEVWSKTYTELNYLENGEEMNSDAFTRQDFAAALFYNDECVALSLFRHIDMDVLANKRDSYFKQWSEIHLKSAARFGTHFLIGGNFAVAPQFRKNTLGLSLKDLLMAIVMEVVLESSADALIGTPRSDKNVNGPCYAWGGIPIALDIDWGLGVRTDLIAILKQNVLAKRDEQELAPVMAELWKNKLIVDQHCFESIDVFKSDRKQALKKSA